MAKSYEYQGKHDDERAVPGIGWVKTGTVITAVDDSHAEKMAESSLFKQVATPKTEPEKTDIEPKKESAPTKAAEKAAKE